LLRSAIAIAIVVASAAVARAQAAPEAYETASTAHVVIDSEEPGIVVSRAGEHGDWERVGIAPCELALPFGPLVLALSMHNRPPTRVPLTLDLDGDLHVLAHYESRQTLRELGVGVLLGTAALVLIGIAIGAGGFLGGTTDVGIGGLVAAGAIGVVGGSIGIALATLDDVATIEIP
jgi:hypothetical protein